MSRTGNCIGLARSKVHLLQFSGRHGAHTLCGFTLFQRFERWITFLQQRQQWEPGRNGFQIAKNLSNSAAGVAFFYEHHGGPCQPRTRSGVNLPYFSCPAQAGELGPDVCRFGHAGRIQARPDAILAQSLFAHLLCLTEYSILTT